MATRVQTTLAELNQVNQFIDSNPVALAGSPEGYAEQVQLFKTALAVIQQATADPSLTVATQTSAQRRTLRQTLRIGQLHPLRRVAKVLKRSIPGMPSLVNIPRKSSSTLKLVSAAQTVVQAVTPYQAQFVSKGMPANFLDQLTQAIQAVQNADAANGTAKQATKNAQGQLTAAVHEAKDAVTCLDVIIRRTCAADPVNGNGTLNAWNTIVPPPVKLSARASLVPPAGAATAPAVGSAGSAPATAPPAAASAGASAGAPTGAADGASGTSTGPVGGSPSQGSTVPAATTNAGGAS